MEWWNFSNTNFLIFFIGMIVLLLALIGLIVTVILESNSYVYLKSNIKKECNTTRIFVVDLNTQSASFFDKSSIRQKHKVTLEAFYGRYSPKDVTRIKSWFYKLNNGDTAVDEFLEADIWIHRHTDKFFSVLRVLKVNPVNGKIFLESHIMRYISPKSSPVSKVKGLPCGVVTLPQMEKLLENQKRAVGYSYCIRFFYGEDLESLGDKINQLMALILKDSVYEFIYEHNKPRQIVEGRSNELLMFDLLTEKKEDAFYLTSKLENSINRAIDINGLKDKLNFAIGIVSNQQFYHDPKTTINTARNACIYAQQNKFQHYFFNRSADMPVVDTTRFNSEISRLINSNSLHYLYRPVFDCVEQRVIGYFVFVQAYDSPFNGYYEMSRYALKVNRNKDLFAHVSKDVINAFANQVSSKSKMFITCAYCDTHYVKDILSQIPASSNVKIVLQFLERDFLGEAIASDSINSLLGGIKSSNVELALLLSDDDLLLDQSTYRLFDYFVIDVSAFGELKRSRHSQLSIHTLVEQLLKFRKPIIANEIDSNQSIELIIQSGITILSSETISPSHSLFLPIMRKKADKLIQLAEKYK